MHHPFGVGPIHRSLKRHLSNSPIYGAHFVLHNRHPTSSKENLKTIRNCVPLSQRTYQKSLCLTEDLTQDINWYLNSSSSGHGLSQLESVRQLQILGRLIDPCFDCPHKACSTIFHKRVISVDCSSSVFLTVDCIWNLCSHHIPPIHQSTEASATPDSAL